MRMLDEAIRRGGLAVIGLQPTLEALEGGQADLLVLSSELPASDREKLVRVGIPPRHQDRDGQRQRAARAKRRRGLPAALPQGADGESGDRCGLKC